VDGASGQDTRLPLDPPAFEELERNGPKDPKLTKNAENVR